MARKLRIEYEGAIYHVLNRGNYRLDLFQSAGEARAFLVTLAEATERYNWRLHAFAIMRNHFHLAVETPEPNLSAGMHWLQSTFGTRFNRFRDERGHLFQGRFQSLVVEDSTHLGRLVDYIHLNPVRAGIIPKENVGAFRWDSLALFLKNLSFRGLCADDWLGHLGLSDDPDGWRAYLDHLRGLADDKARQKELEFDRMSRGWAIGTASWRKALAKEYAHLALDPGLPAAEARALREAGWQAALEGALRAIGKSVADAAAARKFAPWKVELGARLRCETGASTAWLCRNLHLGAANSARVYLSRAIRKQAENITFSA